MPFYQTVVFQLACLIGMNINDINQEKIMQVPPTIETKTFEELLSLSEKSGTLVLSNITNTLYGPTNTMSDKDWRKFLSTFVNEIISNKDQAKKIALRLENIIVNQVDKSLVHKKLPEIIQKLQAQGIPFVGITLKDWSAPYDQDFGITTSKHLKKLGINLEASMPLVGRDKEIIENQTATLHEVEEVIYTFAKGIIFTNKKPLDVALNEFLNTLKVKPTQIIILENSEHKEKLTAVINAHNIALSFIKYKNPETCPSEKFDPMLGTIEFIKFFKENKLIFDDEAEKIKAETPFIDYQGLLKEYILENMNNLLK